MALTSFILTRIKSMGRGDSCSRELLCREILKLYMESHNFHWAGIWNKKRRLKFRKGFPINSPDYSKMEGDEAQEQALKRGIHVKRQPEIPIGKNGPHQYGRTGVLSPQSTPPVRLNVRWLCVVREWQESGQISPGRSSIAFRAEEPSTRVRTMPKTLQSTRAISNSTLR